MEPLDLTQQPPRPCRAELGGIAYLPRAIDKVRASLPGGALGVYINLKDDVPTFSRLFYRSMAVAHDDFSRAVASARGDADVLTWLRGRVDEARIATWNRQLLAVRLCDLDAAQHRRVVGYYPAAATLPPDTKMVDVIDLDDRAMFAERTER